MLMPKKVKYRKQQRGRMAGKAWRGSDVSFGNYGLKALEPAWITDRQIEAARVAMTRFIKRGGKIWVRVFPDKPITKKPQETRMGKGKGAPEQWVCVVRPGRIMFEMEGVTETEAREALRLAAAKLPIKTKFATRFVARGGKVWVRVFPDKPITKKPQETRMGKGKGAPEFWVAVVKPGRVMFELQGITRPLAQAAMKLGASKLSIKTRFVERHQLGGE